VISDYKEKHNMASYNAEGLLVSENSKLGGLFNYSMWKFCISNLLQRNELINLMEPNSDGDFKKGNEKTIEDLEPKKKKTLAIIGLSVRDEIILHIVGITNLAIMW
jgi:hypothetical protein